MAEQSSRKGEEGVFEAVGIYEPYILVSVAYGAIKIS